MAEAVTRMCSIKNFAIYTKISAPESLLNNVTGLQPTILQNLHVFFKNISGRILLEKHWISLKTVPIAIPVNASKTG